MKFNEKITAKEFANYLKGVKELNDFDVFCFARFHGEIPAIRDTDRMRWKINFEQIRKEMVEYLEKDPINPFVYKNDIERTVINNKAYTLMHPECKSHLL